MRLERIKYHDVAVGKPSFEPSECGNKGAILANLRVP
jgi:hypothetical protein